MFKTFSVPVSYEKVMGAYFGGQINNNVGPTSKGFPLKYSNGFHWITKVTGVMNRLPR
jgi:hypothetical protein